MVTIESWSGWRKLLHDLELEFNPKKGEEASKYKLRNHNVNQNRNVLLHMTSPQIDAYYGWSSQLKLENPLQCQEKLKVFRERFDSRKGISEKRLSGKCCSRLKRVFGIAQVRLALY